VAVLQMGTHTHLVDPWMLPAGLNPSSWLPEIDRGCVPDSSGSQGDPHKHA